MQLLMEVVSAWLVEHHLRQHLMLVYLLLLLVHIDCSMP